MNPRSVRSAVVIGCRGQDGTLLCDSLREQGYRVIGLGRNALYGDLDPPSGAIASVADFGFINWLVRSIQPDEIYYLAAYHTSSEQSDNEDYITEYRKAHETHVVGLLHCLSAIREHAPSCRLFYAASSLIFSGEANVLQNEQTPLSPRGFYALTKAQGMLVCREFRDKYGLFASAGILYNHESHLRPPHFLSQKIVQTVTRISRGSREKLVVGNLSAMVDWSYARDFVLAFQKILKLEDAGDFVISSGEAHSVQEFINIAFQFCGLDPKDHVLEDGSVLGRRPSTKIGDASKLRKLTGWTPSYSFPGLVQQLIADHQAHISSRDIQSA